MTYDQLLEWAKAKGKTETDVIKWYAFSEVQAIKDMTDEEMVDWLMKGAFKYDHDYVKSHWDNMDEQTQKEYLQFMTESWEVK